MKSILFLANSGNRGGANIVLFQLAQWLKEKHGFNCIFIFPENGMMVKEFEVFFSVLINDFKAKPRKTIKDKLSYLIRKLLQLDEYHISKTYKSIKRHEVSLIYSNTVHNYNAINFLHKKLKKPLLLHVHEQEYIMKMHNKNENINKQLTIASHIISVCKATYRSLHETFNVPLEKLSLVYPGIDIPVRNGNKSDIKAKLNIPPNTFVVLGMGNPHWIKGTDIFLQVASQVTKIDKDIYFIWVGGNAKSQNFIQMRYDINQISSKQIVLIEHTIKPLEFYSISDLFFLSSRVDSFPLVNQQAAAFKIPVVCFKSSGGSEEFIDDTCGWLVDYLDTKSVIKIILYSKENYKVLRQKGENFHQKLKYDKRYANAKEKVFAIINDLLNQNSNSEK